MNPTSTFEAHANYVLGLAFSHDNRLLISSGMDKAVRLWSVGDWKPVATFEGHANSVNSLSLSPDGRTLATGSTDTTVKLWSFPDGALLHSLRDRKKVVAGVRISPDGRWVGAVSYGGRVKIWTLLGEEVVGFQTEHKNLNALAFSPSAEILAVSGLGDGFSFYELPTGELLRTVSAHQAAVVGLRFIQNGKQLVSLGYEGVLKFWDTSTWQELRSLEPAGKRLRGFAFSAGESRLALSLESQVQLRLADDLSILEDLPVSTKVVNGMAFSPDGRWLAAGCADRKIRVWALE